MIHDFTPLLTPEQAAQLRVALERTLADFEAGMGRLMAAAARTLRASDDEGDDL